MFRILRWIIFGVLVILVVVGIKTDAFTKDSILEVYETIMQWGGNAVLTSKGKLQGERKYGADYYVGTYQASYDGYTGEEILFGGTLLNRKESNQIHMKIQLEKESGTIQVIQQLGDREIIILEDTGEYDDNIYIEGMSYYLKLKLNDFIGNINVVSE